MKFTKMDGCVKVILYAMCVLVGGLGVLIVLTVLGRWFLDPNSFSFGGIALSILGAVFVLGALVAGIVLALIPSDD